MTKESSSTKTEFEAMAVVHDALKGLEPNVQERVLRYVSEMLNLSMASLAPSRANLQEVNRTQDSNPAAMVVTPTTAPDASKDSDDEGISSVALRWMARTDLDSKSLQKLFSLGVDEIDLVAKKIPGENKKERMRNVILLKGIAAYLGTGAPRVTFEQVKEACLHYDAYDSSNFAAHLRSFASEVSGTKESGFTLTARGISSGTDLVKQILAAAG